MSSNTFTFNAGNVVVGDASVAGYAFSTRTTAPRRLTVHRETGPTTVDVDGNVHARGLRLVHVNHNGVLITDDDGTNLSVAPDTSVGDASFFFSGTLDPARVSGDYVMGNLTLPSAPLTAAAFAGNANAALVTSGVLDPARLDGSYAFRSLTVDATTAQTARGNLDTTRLVGGRLDPARLAGAYDFETLTLSGGANASTVRANLATSWITSGTIDPARFVGPYTVANLTIDRATTDVLTLPLPSNRVLVSSGTRVDASPTTTTELSTIKGVTESVQDQLANIESGLVVGNTINNLDATQFTLGTLSDARLQGAYAWSNLVLSDDASVPSVSANLDASLLDRGTIDTARLDAPSYHHVTSVVATETTTAHTVSANLDAAQLVSGTVHPDRLTGAHAFESLEVTTTANAAWINAHMDTSRVVSGTIDPARLDFDPVAANVATAVGTSANLGTASVPWSLAVSNTVTVDDVVMAGPIRKGSATMQFDLEAVASDVVPATGTTTVGTSSVPWSSVTATDLVATDLVVGDQLLDGAGDPLAFDLTRIPSAFAPKLASSVGIGSAARPFGNMVAGTLSTTTVSSNVVTTSLVPSTTHDLGSTSQPWGPVTAANVTALVDGNLVGDIWADVEVTGDVEAPDGVKLPDEARAFRFFADESVGLGLRGTGGGIDLDVAGSTSLRVDPSNVTAAADVRPVTAFDDLGTATARWRDLSMSTVLTGPVGNLSAMTVPAASIATVSAANAIVTESIASQSFVGNVDANSLTGTVPDGLFNGSYAIAEANVLGSLTSTGSLTCGNLVPASGATFDLGSAASRFRDLYVSSSSIVLGSASLSETNGNVVVSSNVVVTDGIGGTGLGAPLVIESVQITDSSWVPVDDTAVGLDGGHCVVTGSGFSPGSLVIVGDTHAPSTTFVSWSQLRVTLPAKGTGGTFDLTVVRPESKSATRPSAITYSQAVTWITPSALGNVEYATPFSIALEANSDSVVSYAVSNVTSLPPETALDSSTGSLTGNISSVLTSTLYSFDVIATDTELQDATRTFLLQLHVP